MRWLRSIFQLEINPGFVMAALVVSVCSVTVFTVTFDQFRQGVVPPPFEVKQIKVEVRPSTLELVIIKRRNAQCLTDIRDFILRLPDEDVAFAYPAVSGGIPRFRINLRSAVHRFCGRPCRPALISLDPLWPTTARIQSVSSSRGSIASLSRSNKPFLKS